MGEPVSPLAPPSCDRSHRGAGPAQLMVRMFANRRFGLRGARSGERLPIEPV
jgi:hypothetical protein